MVNLDCSWHLYYKRFPRTPDRSRCGVLPTKKCQNISHDAHLKTWRRSFSSMIYIYFYGRDLILVVWGLASGLAIRNTGREINLHEFQLYLLSCTPFLRAFLLGHSLRLLLGDEKNFARYLRNINCKSFTLPLKFLEAALITYFTIFGRGKEIRKTWFALNW